jgi:hypothetical protein
VAFAFGVREEDVVISTTLGFSERPLCGDISHLLIQEF